MLFAYTLAKEFGYVDVEELLNKITFDQFIQWFVFYQERPFGYELERRKMFWQSTQTGYIVSALSGKPVIECMPDIDKAFKTQDQTQTQKRPEWEMVYESFNMFSKQNKQLAPVN